MKLVNDLKGLTVGRQKRNDHAFNLHLDKHGEHRDVDDIR
jgi:hypothetical protein